MSEDEIRKDAEYDDDDLGDELAEEQSRQQEQIIETGAVTPTKGKYVIHCLTIVGQIVIVDNNYERIYIITLESHYHRRKHR
jgi:hypothetical protein